MSAGNIPSIDINAFQTTLNTEPRKPLSLGVCLRTIKSLGNSNENRIHKLAQVVRSGIASDAVNQKELAMAVAKLVTESKLFYHISKEDRDAFLSALPFAKTIWKRVQSFVAAFRNKFFFRGNLGKETSSEQIQSNLCGQAEEALFQALNEAKSPENVKERFVASFLPDPKANPGWKRFSLAFQEELTEKASSYTSWWKRLHPLTTEQGKALTQLLEPKTLQEFVFRNKEGTYYKARRSEDRKSVQIRRYGEEGQYVLDLGLNGGQATVRSSGGVFLDELSDQQAELLDAAYTSWRERLHSLTMEQGKELAQLLEPQTLREFVFRNKEGTYYTASRSEDGKSVQIRRYGEEDQDVLDLGLNGGQATVRFSGGVFLGELSAQQAELLDAATATAEAIAKPKSFKLPDVGLKEKELFSLSESLRDKVREVAPEGLASQKKYAVWLQSLDSGYGNAIVIQEAGEFDGQTLFGKLEVDISPNGRVLSIFVDSIPVPIAEFSEEHRNLLRAIYSKISEKAADAPQKKRAESKALFDDLPDDQATEAAPQKTTPAKSEETAAAAIAQRRLEPSPEEQKLEEKQREGIRLLGKMQTFINNLKKEDLSSMVIRLAFSQVEKKKKSLIENLQGIQGAMADTATKTALGDTVAQALAMLNDNVKKKLKSVLTAEKFKEISDLITEAEQFQASLV